MSTIPVIDLSCCYDGNLARRQDLGREIDSVCRSIGFFTVSGHRVAPRLIDDLLGVARAFFDQPVEEKLKYQACLLYTSPSPRD